MWKKIRNTGIITDIYGRLLRSRYKTATDVRELGDILKKTPIVPNELE